MHTPLSDRGARVAGCDLSYGHGVRFPLFLQHDGHSRLVVGTLVLVENYSLLQGPGFGQGTAGCAIFLRASRLACDVGVFQELSGGRR